MTDLDLDGIDVLADETDDDYRRIRASDLESLRTAAKSSAKHRKEADDLRRDKAISEAGLKDLNADQLETLGLVVKEPSADALRAKAVALGFIAPPEPVVTPEQQQQEAQELDLAAQVANGAGAPANDQITAADTGSWDSATKARFATTHPELARDLSTGQTIKRPPGWTA